MKGLQPCSPLTVSSANRERPPKEQKTAMSGQPVGPPTTNLRITKGQVVAPRLAGSSVSDVSPRTARTSQWDGFCTSKGSSKENISTPVKAFINSNITPRSGPRKARVDSTASTPTGTPNGTPTSMRPVSTITTNDRGVENYKAVNGLGLRGVGAVRKSRSGSVASNGKSSVLSSPGFSPEANVYSRSTTSPEDSPMFFHASDARFSFPSKTSAQRPQMQSKSPSFLHANGDQEQDMETSPLSATPPSEAPQSKFFHADVAPVTESERLKSNILAFPVAASPPPPKPGSFEPHHVVPSHQLPSPLKDPDLSRKPSIHKASPRRHLSLAPQGGLHQIEPPQIASPTFSGVTRRSSLKLTTETNARHSKSSSVNSMDSFINRKRNVPSLVERSPLTPRERRASIAAKPEPSVEYNKVPSIQQPSLLPTPTKSNQTPNVHSPSPLSTPTKHTKTPDAQSPSSTPIGTKPITIQSNLDDLNELAANARRERKVLDLEISNSSLLAINRTLEKELRKQNAELRRYRRLTQAGRISIAPSKRFLSTCLSILTFSDAESDASGSSDNGDTIDLGFSGDDNESSSNVSRSPAAQIEHDARQRAKDEKRLQIDLSKHQELLVDSQKMNQSLKRCLGWTEDLIAEGKKALNFQVETSDLELKGRVLTPDEIETETTPRTGLLSPGHDRIPHPLETSLSYRGSLLGVDNKDAGFEVEPSLESKDEGGLGLGDYLDSLGESWGL
ncbi:MAG: hypothetical protein Q9187_000322 [Circinaria calcarea]